MKRHNGGAGVIRCNHVETTAEIENYRTPLSGKMRTFNGDDTSHVVKHPDYGTLDDPSTHTSVVYDLFDTTIGYEVLTYGTRIVNNTFSNNYSGKRGTAMLIERVNEVQIIDNKFMANGPVQAYAELANSPYYKSFLYKKRTLAYYLLDKDTLGDCTDESAWFNRCYRTGFAIDMPQV